MFSNARRSYPKANRPINPISGLGTNLGRRIGIPTSSVTISKLRAHESNMKVQ